MRTTMTRILRKLAEVRACIADARLRTGLSAFVVVPRFVRMYGVHLYSLDEIRYHDLLVRGLTEDELRFRQSKEKQLRMQRLLNAEGDEAWVENKEWFASICEEAELPCPAPQCVITLNPEADSQDSPSEERIAALPPSDYIVKPVDGVHGAGVTGLAVHGDVLEWNHGEKGTARAFCEWLSRYGSGKHYIIQERLWSHPDINELTGSPCLQTVRMVSFRRSNDTIFIGCCQMRLIQGDSVVDNFHDGRGGNLIADIPEAGGIISTAYAPAEGQPGFRVVTAHPDTGREIPGFRIPHWDSARDLVKRAAGKFSPLVTVGWDVGITEAGPVLVEGNTTWDPCYESDLGSEVLRAVLDDPVRRSGVSRFGWTRLRGQS